MLVIVHSGQTGVERGAHRGAMKAGFEVAGFMPSDRRDEFGPIPAEIAAKLTPCLERGPRRAVRANIDSVCGLLVVVPEAHAAHRFTAMTSILQAARAANVTCYACDGKTNLDDAAEWIRRLPQTSGSMRVAVTGPRGTRWQQGEAIARRLVAAIAIIE